MRALFNLLNIDDNTIRQKTLEAIVVIVQQNYRLMGDYLEQFYLMTQKFIQADDDDGQVSQLSIEVWSSLFEEELNEQGINERVDIIKRFDW